MAVLFIDIVYSIISLGTACTFGDDSEVVRITAVAMFAVVGMVLPIVVFSIMVWNHYVETGEKKCRANMLCACLSLFEALGFLFYYIGDNLPSAMSIWSHDSTEEKNSRIAARPFLALGALFLMVLPHAINLYKKAEKANEEDASQTVVISIVATFVKVDVLYTAIGDIVGKNCSKVLLAIDFAAILLPFWITFTVFACVIGWKVRPQSSKCWNCAHLTLIVTAYPFYLIGDNTRPLHCFYDCDHEPYPIVCRQKLYGRRTVFNIVAAVLLAISISKEIHHVIKLCYGWTKSCCKSCCGCTKPCNRGIPYEHISMTPLEESGSHEDQ